MVLENGPIFLKAVNCADEYKDNFFISNLMKECIEQVRTTNLIQVITDNVDVCKAIGLLIKAIIPRSVGNLVWCIRLILP